MALVERSLTHRLQCGPWWGGGQEEGVGTVGRGAQEEGWVQWGGGRRRRGGYSGEGGAGGGGYRSRGVRGGGFQPRLTSGDSADHQAHLQRDRVEGVCAGEGGCKRRGLSRGARGEGRIPPPPCPTTPALQV